MYPVSSNSRLKNHNFASGTRPARSLAAAVTAAVVLAIFSALVIAPQPAQAQTEAVLWNFQNTPDGAVPTSGLTLNNGNYYGTACMGGNGPYGSASSCSGVSGSGGGTVFEVTPNGSGGWTETAIYNFCSQPNCTDGENPLYSGVIFDPNGNLYGATYNGGANGYGVVYELSPAGNGTWTEKVLYSFQNTPDGANPINGLIMDSAGNLYGTTFGGGNTGNGTLFELSPSGNAWTERNLSTINSVGSGLTIDSAGNIYGTTWQAIFKLTPNGQGGFTSQVLFTFNPALSQKEGSEPTGTLAVDSAGNIYGTTMTGGAYNYGVAYELVKGSSGYTPKVLKYFSTAVGENGVYPFAGVTLDPAGNLYGTTTEGGQFNKPPGDGTVYELVAAQNYKERRLFSFNGETGAFPYAPLVWNNGYLYGTTIYGGDQGNGTVFISNPNAAVTSITLTSSPNPSNYGQAVTFTATVTSPNGPPPDGEAVVFEPIGQAPMTNGVAQYTVKNLPQGVTRLHAVFEGDLNFLYVKSATYYQHVN